MLIISPEVSGRLSLSKSRTHASRGPSTTSVEHVDMLMHMHMYMCDMCMQQDATNDPPAVARKGDRVSLASTALVASGANVPAVARVCYLRGARRHAERVVSCMRCVVEMSGSRWRA